MRDEVFLPRKGFVAERAGVRRIARVSPDVVVEVFLARERLWAVCALVWCFPRVLTATDNTYNPICKHLLLQITLLLLLQNNIYDFISKLLCTFAN